MKRAVADLRPKDIEAIRNELDPIVPENDPTIVRLAQAGRPGASIKRTIDATRDAAWRYRPRPHPGDVHIVRSVHSSASIKAGAVSNGFGRAGSTAICGCTTPLCRTSISSAAAARSWRR